MAKKEKVFNIDQLSSEEIGTLSTLLGEKVRDVCDKAVARANKILIPYGVECKMAFKIDKLGSFAPKNKIEGNLK